MMSLLLEKKMKRRRRCEKRRKIWRCQRISGPEGRSSLINTTQQTVLCIYCTHICVLFAAYGMPWCIRFNTFHPPYLKLSFFH